MEKKIEKLSALMKNNEWDKAIKMAAKFPRLGEHKAPITRAASAMLSPNLYISMGKKPDDLFNAGIIALRERYAKYL